MKFIKYIVHPFSYIILFIIVSLLARIPHGLGWRSESQQYIYEYFWIYVFYVVFYFLGYFSIKYKITDKYRPISQQVLMYFHILYVISILFFIAKMVYIGGIPLWGSTTMRTKMAGLGGFVDYPTKLVSLLGIISYFFYTRNKQVIFIIYTIISLVLNLLFAERALLVFTLLGSLFLYILNNEISKKMFLTTMLLGVIVAVSISWIQIKRHGGQNHLDLSGKMSFVEVSFWIISGDLSGSQKLGAYVLNKTKGEPLYGKYTLGMYLSTIIPNYKNHGAEYIQKNFTSARTAQSVAIPFSYYLDFKYFYVILPFIIGIISKILYYKFITLNNPFYVILYIVFFFELLWSIRSGIIPFSPKFLYFALSLLFLFGLPAKKLTSKLFIFFLRILFICTLILSFIMLLARW